MWLLDFVPHWIYWTLLGFSGIAVCTGWGVAWRNYNFFAAVFCVWYLSCAATQASWKTEVARLQAQAKLAAEQSHAVNETIATNTITKIKKVKEIEYVNKEIIQQVVVKELDNSCLLPQSAVVLHNSASQNTVASGAAEVAGTASEVKASELLSTIVENYAACYDSITKLEAWQAWYAAQKQIYESTK